MTERPKTLREMLAEGSLNFRTKEAAEILADEEHLRIEKVLLSSRDEAMTNPRRPGRPPINQPRRITMVRSLRLEVSLWERLDKLSEEIGCSTNRFIEESIFTRIGALSFLSSFPGTITTSWSTSITNDNFEHRNTAMPKIVTYEASAA